MPLAHVKHDLKASKQHKKIIHKLNKKNLLYLYSVLIFPKKSRGLSLSHLDSQTMQRYSIL